uniref:FACT complex subunit n=1 Tax=Strongyloides venezuelensis TaxID=75913 RepID=A0A0K0G0W2_STRVS
MSEKRVLQINKDLFHSRATRLYEHWETEESLRDIHAFVFLMGSDDDSISYSKTLSLHAWLYSCTIVDTIIVLTKKQIYFLGSSKKTKYFQPVESGEFHGKVPPFKAMVRDKTDKDKANMTTLINVLKESGTNYGFFSKDRYITDFAKAWTEMTLTSDIHQRFTDVSVSFARLFAVKDEKEITYMKNSAQATINAWTHLKQRIVTIIDQDKKVKHSKLADEMGNDFSSVVVQGGLVDKGVMDVCYTPIIQSGGKYVLKYSAESDDKPLHFGTIISSFGMHFNSYCTNLTRTLMVDPPKDLESAYETLLSAQLAVINALKPGAKVCDAYKAGIDCIKEANPKLLDNLFKPNFGFMIGIEFREPAYLINEKCTEIVKENMTFTVALGFQNIKNPRAKDESSKIISLMVGDTILVSDDGSNEILTEKAKSRTKAVCIRYNEDPKSGKEENKENSQAAYGRGKRSVLLNEQTRNKTTNEEKRKTKQKELMVRLNEEARDRMIGKSKDTNTVKEKKSNVSYKKYSRFPQTDEVKERLIYVDKENLSVILPIFGYPVPFHISVIKNCSQSVEGDYTYLRINFSHPGSQVGQKDSSTSVNPLLSYVKELTFRTSNIREPGELNTPSHNLEQSYRFIKEMQKKFKTKEAEEREAEGTVKQDKLIISNSKNNPRLKDLFVRPSIVAKKVSGSLEAHVNGFRYTSLKGDKIDVLYNNIKHSIFQPCDNEMIILIHFNLKNPVLWGKKKYSDIQFYTEVGELTTDLGKFHHMQEKDDIKAEQMEREMRKRLNQAFQNFCDKVTKQTNDQIDFDIPYQTLGFYGVPYRSSVFLKPTSACLVSLTEWPTLVITLSEVELVHFERVSFQLKNFDMVFVFKDYTKPVQFIQQIPTHQLDSVKEWLHSCDIRYTEGIQSLKWSKIMKTIIDDPETFFDDGGWNFLCDESGDEGADVESDSEESVFSLSEAGESDESGEDEEYDSGEVTEDSESEASLDSDESSGKDWSDLEEEAARHDRQKSSKDEDEDLSRKRKNPSKGGGFGNAAKRRR